MSSAMITQTLQGAVLSMTSNVLAQAISSFKDSTPFALNMVPVAKFAVFSVISNPPNILWQTFLEDHFPTKVPSSAQKTGDEKPASPNQTATSTTNILIKFLLDQTIGAVVNTMLFLAYMAYVNASQQGKANAWDAVYKECSQKTWPMMKDGYKFWPAISLISFVWVPVDKRVVFGCSVGVLWGIYLSLVVDA